MFEEADNNIAEYTKKELNIKMKGYGSPKKIKVPHDPVLSSIFAKKSIWKRMRDSEVLTTKKALKNFNSGISARLKMSDFKSPTTTLKTRDLKKLMSAYDTLFNHINRYQELQGMAPAERALIEEKLERESSFMRTYKIVESCYKMEELLLAVEESKPGEHERLNKEQAHQFAEYLSKLEKGTELYNAYYHILEEHNKHNGVTKKAEEMKHDLLKDTIAINIQKLNDSTASTEEDEKLIQEIEEQIRKLSPNERTFFERQLAQAKKDLNGSNIVQRLNDILGTESIDGILFSEMDLNKVENLLEEAENCLLKIDHLGLGISSTDYQDSYARAIIYRDELARSNSFNNVHEEDDELAEEIEFCFEFAEKDGLKNPTPQELLAYIEEQNNFLDKLDVLVKEAEARKMHLADTYRRRLGNLEADFKKYTTEQSFLDAITEKTLDFDDALAQNDLVEARELLKDYKHMLASLQMVAIEDHTEQYLAKIEEKEVLNLKQMDQMLLEFDTLEPKLQEKFMSDMRQYLNKIPEDKIAEYTKKIEEKEKSIQNQQRDEVQEKLEQSLSNFGTLSDENQKNASIAYMYQLLEGIKEVTLKEKYKKLIEEKKDSLIKKDSKTDPTLANGVGLQELNQHLIKLKGLVDGANLSKETIESIINSLEGYKVLLNNPLIQCEAILNQIRPKTKEDEPVINSIEPVDSTKDEESQLVFQNFQKKIGYFIHYTDQYDEKKEAKLVDEITKQRDAGVLSNQQYDDLRYNLENQVLSMTPEGRKKIEGKRLRKELEKREQMRLAQEEKEKLEREEEEKRETLKQQLREEILAENELKEQQWKEAFLKEQQEKQEALKQQWLQEASLAQKSEKNEVEEPIQVPAKTSEEEQIDAAKKLISDEAYKHAYERLKEVGTENDANKLRSLLEQNVSQHTISIEQYDFLQRELEKICAQNEYRTRITQKNIDGVQRMLHDPNAVDLFSIKMPEINVRK